MSTITIRVTSSAVNPQNNGYGQQPDFGAPSYFDMVVENSTDPNLPNGRYDAYCLDPLLNIFTGTNYQAENFAGNSASGVAGSAINGLTQAALDRINWILAQNFTSDPKYNNQFNFGEVQSAIWKILGYSQAQIDNSGIQFLNDNFRNTLVAADTDFIVQASQQAIASGKGVLPTDAFFTTIVDPAGNIQPLIVQLQSAKLGNYVWLDGDRDGLQDAGEQGVDNVIVELYDASGNKVASTLTGDDFSTAAVEQGFYQFTGLAAGSYTVKFVAPADFALTLQDANANGSDATDSDADVLSGFTQTVTLAAGESNQTLDAGLVSTLPQTAAIGNRVWDDLNGNGIQDPGEPGVGGVVIDLVRLLPDGSQEIAGTTVTALDGSYLFTDVPPGEYALDIQESTLPLGFLGFTLPNVGDNENDSDVETRGGLIRLEFGATAFTTLSAGETDLSWDMGLIRASRIAGNVYEDAGDDGVRGVGETGIGGVTITLTGTDIFGTAVTLTTVTEPDGSYQFNNLVAGNYTVTEGATPNYVDGKDTAGSLGGDAATVNDQISGIVLLPGQSSEENNFGELPASASISGFVYCDDDNDGVKDAGEAGLGGVSVRLTGTNVLGQTVDQTVLTNPDGSYSFTGLRAGTYTVTEQTQPADKLDGKDTAGSTGGDTSVNEVISSIVLADGQQSVNNNFGEVLPARIAGFVYRDDNDDGVKDVGEQGLGGVNVRLTGTNDLGQFIDFTYTTNPDGSYEFVNLRPGTYAVTEVVQPADLVDGKDTAGSAGGSTTVNEVISGIVLASGTNSINNNFGELLPGSSISGFVYCDDDNDGVKDAGEQGLGGVTVRLTGTNDLGQAVSIDRVTGADGSYSFTGLRPGTYTVTELTQPADKLDGKDTAGSTGGDATTVNEQISGIVLGAGVNSVNNNFGEVLPARIAGFVYCDDNDDGIKQSTEQGLGGVLVRLTGTNDLGQAITREATTAADGSYAFEGLRPGTYAVTEVTQPADKLDGKDTAGSAGGDATTVNEQISGIVLASGTNSVNNNFGELLPGSSISGFVYCDDDNDGVKDAGEQGLGGVTVRLTGTNDLGQAVSIDKVTGADGSYSFTGLRPGTYTVTELTQPADKLDGKDTAGPTGGNATAVNEQISGIVLGAGVNSVNNNFGEVLPARIAGFVYCDDNDDGIKQGTEQGLGGVLVRLTGTDDLGQAITREATTAADGSYAFEGLRPGTYTVTEVTQPADKLDGKDTAGSAGGSTAVNEVISGIVLASGTNSINNNFGELLPGSSISGFVYCDDDNDGVKDAGEQGLGGVTVRLTGTNDLGQAVSIDRVTGADGSYSFTGLRPGTYTVTELTQPADKLDGKDTAGSTGGNATAVNEQISGIVLGAGVNSVNNNFGEVLPARIAGFVYCDDNDDGIKQGTEQGLGGVLVRLAGTDDLGQAITREATTAPDGSYAFEGLRPGTYAVTEVTQPADKLDGKDTAGSAGGNATAVNDQISGIVLAPGTNSINNNFGELLPGSSISGFVYCDDDNDGVKDAGEQGLGGVTVRLTGTNDLGQSVSIDKVTGADGSYSFTGLRPGTYTVTELTQPADKLDGKDTAGSTGGNATAVNEQISGIVLGAGVNSVNNNFGELLPAKISGFVYEDKDNDGLKEAGETGIPNVTIRLTGTDDRGNAVDRSTTTGADGSYSFDGLRPGNYVVSESQPLSFADGKDTAGSTGGQVTNDVISAVRVDAGQHSQNNNFGELKFAKLGDCVWLDTNKNGQQDQGESGVGGVLVKLLDLNGNVVATRTTGSDGGYLFDNLTPGSYRVEFVAPQGFSFTTANLGNDFTDSDADATTGRTGIYELESGEDEPTVDAGLVQCTVTLGDRVWLDFNNNGIQDGGESGIAGVKVTLVGAGTDGQFGTADDTTRHTTTGANGIYQFTNVAWGQYKVRFDSVDGLKLTTANVGDDTRDSDAVARVVKGTQNLVVNGSFEQGSTGWTGRGDGVEVGHVGSYGVSGATGSQVLELDANRTYSVTGVSQDIQTVAGQTYELSLDVAARSGTSASTNTVEVFWRGSKIATIDPTSTAFKTFSFTVEGSGAKDRLELREQSGDDDSLGGMVDNVRLVTCDTINETGTIVVASCDDNLTIDAGFGTICRPVNFNFEGNTATDGTDGNSRSYTDSATGVSVTARAFSQTKGSDSWQKAFLGAYGGGLGVTDSGEGSGSGNAHTVDNSGRNNFIVLQFSQEVTVDKAFLGYVSGDSDAQFWIGNSATPITTMSNAVLAGMKATEVSLGGSSTRWADINGNAVSGNVLIIAANTTNGDSNDNFKLEQLAVCAPELGQAGKASIGNFVWEDADADGVQDSTEKGIAGITVKLFTAAGVYITSTTTDANGRYEFNGLNPGDYKVQVIAPTGYTVTGRDKGGNDALDSDIDSSGMSSTVSVVAGEYDDSVDGGLYRKASVGDKVWEDKDHDNVQDSTEPGIGGIRISLYNAANVLVKSTTTDSQGNYKFDNLDPGQYYLQFDKGNVQYNGVNMSNWKWAVKDSGGNDAIDSDVAGNAVATTNVTRTDLFTLVSGQHDGTRDAGITPIVIDLDGNGIQTIARDDAQGAFDLFGNGKAVVSGWISGGDGFLAIDTNGNGKIDDISELFGGTGKGAGFAKLADFDSNGDGLVNAADDRFAELKVWRDADGDHSSDAGELASLAQAGIAALTVAYTELPALDAQGNLHLERSSATLADGRSVDMTDVYFNVSAEDAAAAGVTLPSMAELLGNDQSLDTLLGMPVAAGTGVAEPAAACGGDAAEALRRITALKQEDCHASPAA